MSIPIPVATLDQHIIVLGKTRSGKSSKARVIVEHLLDLERPVCILDPKGDWYGLRSSRSGKETGYPVVIFGGEHADYPVNEHSGAVVAELIASGNRPAIVDLGGWMVGPRTRFFIEFAESFFRHAKGRRWLVIDEVHNFAPQSQGRIADVQTGKMLHWANRLASEGSGKGINLISASQRPQKTHKDYVTSHETLIACRAIHPLDLAAMEDWMRGFDPTKAKEVRASLPQMQRTDAWVWSPEIDFGPKQITWPLFQTFDSFAAPTGDTKHGKLKGWAAIEETEISERLAAVLEEKKANDPAELRREIARLTAENEERARNIEPQLDPAMIEDAKRQGYSIGAADMRRQYENAIAILMQQWEDAAPKIEHLHTELEVLRHFAPDAIAAPAATPFPEIPKETIGKPWRIKMPKDYVKSNGRGIAPTKTSPTVRKVLDAIHRVHPMALSFEAAAMRAAVSRRSSAYESYRKEIEASPEVRRREDGRFVSAPGYHAPIDPGRDPVEEFASKLPPSFAAMLRAIAKAHGRELDRETIAAQAGVSPTSSGLSAGLREIEALGLIVSRDKGKFFKLHPDIV